MEKTRLQDLIIGIVVVVISALAAVKIPKMPGSTKVYTSIIVGAFCLLGILLIGQAIWKRHIPTKDTVLNFKALGNPMICFVIVVVYVFAMEKIGFFVSSAVFMAGLSLFMGYKRISMLVLTVVGMLGFVYWLFVYTLGVYLPQGILF